MSLETDEILNHPFEATGRLETDEILNSSYGAKKTVKKINSTKKVSTKKEIRCETDEILNHPYEATGRLETEEILNF